MARDVWGMRDGASPRKDGAKAESRERSSEKDGKTQKEPSPV